MRHLIYHFSFLASISSLLFPVLAQPSGLVSPPSIFHLQHIKLSHGSMDEVWNKTGHFASSYPGSVAQEEASLIVNERLSYRRVVRHVVHLKPRGSRTISGLRRGGKQRFSATETTSVRPIEVTLWSVFLAQCRVLFVAGICLLWVFSSPRGIVCFLENLRAIILWTFTFFTVQTLMWAFVCFWGMIIWIDESVEYVAPWLMNTSGSLSAPFNHFREKINVKEREWKKLNCILRKKAISRPHVRPIGQRSAIPLFHEQAHEDIQHLYLPEERDDPLRHMHDPRYFSHLQKIGAGAFGSIYLVEHRITGKTMAMKTLLRRENSSEEIGLEIRALLRVQGKAWFPKLLSTFMDSMNFYILMVCHDVNLQLFV